MGEKYKTIEGVTTEVAQEILTPSIGPERGACTLLTLRVAIGARTWVLWEEVRLAIPGKWPALSSRSRAVATSCCDLRECGVFQLYAPSTSNYSTELLFFDSSWDTVGLADGQ